MADEQQNKLMAVLDKIPIFASFPPKFKMMLLNIAKKITLESGEILCKEGDPSKDMFILLNGTLAVKVTNTLVVATITPIGLIGEMGVFTAQPRTATVEAIEQSNLLSIQASGINNILEKYPEVGVKVQRHVIELLTERIKNHNARMKEFQKYVAAQEFMSKD